MYFSLGSNVGNRQKFLAGAARALEKHVSRISVSSIYQTEPWGEKDQPVFLNACVSGQTSLKPEELLDFLKSIEKSLGRKHTEKWGPREIDIDILFYGNQILKLPGLEIPHPHLAERAFVLIPLSEIAPGLIHPVLKQPISELAAAISHKGIEKVSENE